MITSSQPTRRRFHPGAYGLLLLMLLSGLAFTGCPHQIAEVIDEINPPDDYDPGYLKANITLDDLKERYPDIAASGSPGSSSGPSVDTLRAADGLRPSGSRVGPITMDIRTVDDSRYPDRVELNAYVYDSAGSYIAGLAPPNFSGSGRWNDLWFGLTDSCSGIAHRISDYTVEEVSEENREPYSMAFVLDHSGSMGEYRVRVLRKAVALLLKGISKRDNVAILTFSTDVFTEVPLTGDKRRWVTSFDSSNISNYGGGTSLYDAALVGIEQVARGPEGTRKVVILFTDGYDGGSSHPIEDVYRKAREENVTIYTIGYGPADHEILENLAHYSGGRRYKIYRSREFLDVFIDLYRRMNRYYRISYRPPECSGIHTAHADLALPQLGISRLWGEGEYDRSVFTPFDTVGSIVFLNIEFNTNEATILESSLPKIQEVADVMLRDRTIRIEVRGHTDDEGTEEYNQKLSERRAEAVADRLAGFGVSRSRLSVRGFGESSPLVPNDSEEHRRMNRRTEFVVLGR